MKLERGNFSFQHKIYKIVLMILRFHIIAKLRNMKQFGMMLKKWMKRNIFTNLRQADQTEIFILWLNLMFMGWFPLFALLIHLTQCHT